MMRSLLALGLTFGVSGCVLPDRPASGVEMTWAIEELNIADGEETRLIRSCDGLMISDVRFTITDLDPSIPEGSRQANFDFDCEDGFQVAVGFPPPTTSAFIELRPGTYQVETEVFDHNTPIEGPLTSSLTEVTIGGAEVIWWSLTVPTVDVNLEISGLEECKTVSAQVFYADPLGSLVTNPSAFEVTPESGTDTSGTSTTASTIEAIPYRSGLTADSGVVFDGSNYKCTRVNGAQILPELDRGKYTIEWKVKAKDGSTSTCASELTVHEASSDFALDLEQLGC